MPALPASSSYKKPTVHRLLSRSGAGRALASLLLTATASAAPVLTEVEGVRQLCSRGPNAALALARRLQGSAEVTAASVLPNPSLLIEHQRTLSGPRERETVVGLSVPIAVSGRRGLLQDAAAAHRERAFADADVTSFASALAFREAYLTALKERGRAEILGEQQLALEASSAAIEALAKGGEAAGYDLLRQQVQTRSHRGLLESARSRALGSRIALEAWTESEIELPQVQLSELADVGSALSAGPAEPPTPRVRSLHAAARAGALEARAARRRWVPDPEVFAGYRGLDNTDLAHGLSLSLRLPLTFFDHGQGDAARADAERLLAEASAEQLSRRQRAEARAARARLQQLVSGISDLGRARSDAQALSSQAQRLYSAGEVSITEVLEAFRAAEDARLTELDRAFEIALAKIDVMRATGTLFDPNLDQACKHPEQNKR
ncbi:MAG: hypothetical protein RL685_918 [Pseudomonadota bacterium]|jgi:cobalt-zinc-cadmium efflux system outer membrane protein